ncbi:SH3 domain-containing protein [Leptospira interrogans]|uniref:SH3 domain-containing protein n=1 Tax=Leptospira interrogans TaxID=173 RepID=UPI0002C00FE6|nr:SH3 domain-containing protein [Leptospira interrogans]EMN52017.1 hypothetical protein LEP1GSC089_0014 [Leptospira interrogans serovar Autumnalis str. LP101]
MILKKFFLAILLLNSLQVSGESSTEVIKLFSIIDGVKIRETPQLDSNEIKKLSSSEIVSWKGEVSNNKVDGIINNNTINAPFFKIVTKNGLEGWVFSGALEKEEKNIWRKCNRSIPSSIAKASSNFRLEIDKNIGFESFNIDQNTKLEIQNYGCEAYLVEFYFIIKGAKFKKRTVSVFKEKVKYLLNKTKEKTNSPLSIDQAIKVLDQKKFQFNKNIPYTENEFGQFIIFRKPKFKKGLEIIHISFIINL